MQNTSIIQPKHNDYGQPHKINRRQKIRNFKRLTMDTFSIQNFLITERQLYSEHQKKVKQIPQYIKATKQLQLLQKQSLFKNHLPPPTSKPQIKRLGKFQSPRASSSASHSIQNRRDKSPVQRITASPSLNISRRVSRGGIFSRPNTQTISGVQNRIRQSPVKDKHPLLDAYTRRYQQIKDRNQILFEKDKLNLLRHELGKQSISFKLQEDITHRLNSLSKSPRQIKTNKIRNKNIDRLSPIKQLNQEPNMQSNKNSQADISKMAEQLQPKSLSKFLYLSSARRGSNNRTLSAGINPYLSKPLQIVSSQITNKQKPLAGTHKNNFRIARWSKERIHVQNILRKEPIEIAKRGTSSFLKSENQLTSFTQIVSNKSTIKQVQQENKKLSKKTNLLKRNELLNQASFLIKRTYHPNLKNNNTFRLLADIRMTAKQETDQHIAQMKSLANNSPGLKSFFWAPDMSFAAFAPSKLIKTTQEKWDIDESRLDLHNHPEANLPPRSNINSRAQKRLA